MGLHSVGLVATRELEQHYNPVHAEMDRQMWPFNQISSCDVRLPPRRLFNEHDHLSGYRFEFLAHLCRTPNPAIRVRFSNNPHRQDLFKGHWTHAALLFLIGRRYGNFDLLFISTEGSRSSQILHCSLGSWCVPDCVATRCRNTQPRHWLEASHPKHPARAASSLQPSIYFAKKALPRSGSSTKTIRTGCVAHI